MRKGLKFGLLLASLGLVTLSSCSIEIDPHIPGIGSNPVESNTPSSSVVHAEKIGDVPESKEIKVGDSIYITPYVYPSNAKETLEVDTLNSNIATVIKSGDGYYIQGVAEGETFITYRCGDLYERTVVTVVGNEINCTSIFFDASDVSLKVNESYTLGYHVTPSNTTDKVTWTSSDSTVVSVSNGVLRGLKVGTATITAACGTYRTTCKVTVKDNTLACTAISLSKSSLSLEVGKTSTLVPSVTPTNTTDTITWLSSNTEVATVVNGVVTAKKSGSTTITAKCGTKSATCQVTVTANTACTGISLSKSAETVITNKTLQLSATVTPTTTTDTVTWSTSDSTVCTVSSSGLVSGVKVGTATITATCGTKSASCTITVKDAIDFTVGNRTTYTDGVKFACTIKNNTSSSISKLTNVRIIIKVNGITRVDAHFTEFKFSQSSIAAGGTGTSDFSTIAYASRSDVPTGYSCWYYSGSYYSCDLSWWKSNTGSVTYTTSIEYDYE